MPFLRISALNKKLLMLLACGGKKKSTASKFKPSISNRIARYHLNRHPLSITYNEILNRVSLNPCPADRSAMDLLTQSHAAILTCFKNTQCHPHRFIYCLAGRLFFSAAPLPFGGPRKTPGYAAFEGEDPDQLLSFIIEAAFKVYWNARGRAGLEIIVETVNLILDWHKQRRKDELDELMLKGMKKAGHIPWFGASSILEPLRHVDEVDSRLECVLFSPRRSSLRTSPNE
ncbi:hypothetical protein BDR26DRAFT_41528 [Obelidium mucronatum]|nr:hypothetical protein BDR26DRAFT_41528 [Obelidium mucronatum]